MSPSVGRVMLALVLVSNQSPQTEHKALAVPTDDNRRLTWDGEAETSVISSARPMTVGTRMPTGIAVGVGGHGMTQMISNTFVSLHPRDCSHTERREPIVTVTQILRRTVTMTV